MSGDGGKSADAAAGDYRVLVKFVNGRQDVWLAARDLHSAVQMFQAAHAMDYVGSVTMTGLLGRAQAPAPAPAPQQQQPQQQQPRRDPQTTATLDYLRSGLRNVREAAQASGQGNHPSQREPQEDSDLRHDDNASMQEQPMEVEPAPVFTPMRPFVPVPSQLHEQEDEPEPLITKPVRAGFKRTTAASPHDAHQQRLRPSKEDLAELLQLRDELDRLERSGPHNSGLYDSMAAFIETRVQTKLHSLDWSQHESYLPDLDALARRCAERTNKRQRNE